MFKSLFVFVVSASEQEVSLWHPFFLILFFPVIMCQPIILCGTGVAPNANSGPVAVHQTKDEITL